MNRDEREMWFVWLSFVGLVTTVVFALLVSFHYAMR